MIIIGISEFQKKRKKNSLTIIFASAFTLIVLP
ncbi:DUF3953 domain-containing protein [Sporosarcina sp. NCCP-2716]